MFEYLPLISSRAAWIDRVKAALSGTAFEPQEYLCLGDSRAALEHLAVEMPVLYLVDFSDPEMDSFGILDEIMADPWLMDGGMIAVHSDKAQSKRLAEIQGANLILSLAEAELDSYLSNVFEIIHNNRRLMHQRGLGADLVNNITASFKLKNDPLVARCYVNLVCNFLYNVGRFSLEQKSQVHLAVTEMFLNAIEHGNCGISYEEKSACLESGRAVSDLVAERVQQPEIARRRVSFEYSLQADYASFRIADEGDGFDWRNTRDPMAEENMFAMHGRGILMSRAATAELDYNEKGNEVSFKVPYVVAEGEALCPSIFQDHPVAEVKAGETIFTQGERSDHLFYIATGHFNVMAGEAVAAQLTPDDIFLGEMSFLLNNRRSATVVADTDGRLISISRKDFVAAIRQRPQYSLFLARLMAQRLERITSSQQVQQSADLFSTLV